MATMHYQAYLPPSLDTLIMSPAQSFQELRLWLQQQLLITLVLQAQDQWLAPTQSLPHKVPCLPITTALFIHLAY